MNKSDGIHIPGRYAVVLLSTLLTGAITFNVWAVTAVNARPTEPKVKELIEDKSPYAKDRGMILSMLQDIRQDIADLKSILRNR